MQQFAEIILPLAVRSEYHYRLRLDQIGNVQPGMRVLVSFGKRRIYTGLVRRVLDSLPREISPDRLKYVEEVLDEVPILTPQHVELFDWISFYYMCTPGEVFKASLPAGMKPESSLKVEMTEGLNWEQLELDDREFVLMEALSIQPVLGLPEIAKIWDISTLQPRLKAMAARGLIRMFEE